MAAFGHGVARVEDQVHQRQLELVFVRERVPDVVRDAPVDLDQAAERVLEQALERLDEARRRDRGGLELLPPGEGEQALDQLGALFGRAAGHGDELLLFGVERHALFDESESAEHRGEQIVEIVGDAAGELADRVHLLRLGELAFELALIGHVEQRARDLDRLTRAVAQHHRLFEQMTPAAIGVLPAIFAREAVGAADAIARRDDALAILRVKPLGPQAGSRLDLVEVEAGQRLEIAAHEVRHARARLDRLQVKHERQRAEHQRLALLGAAQGLLGQQHFLMDARILVAQPPLLHHLALDLAGLVVKVDEHRDLRAQDQRLDRLEHVIDRAHRIAAAQMRVLLVDRRQEDDRDALRLLALANDLRGFVAVHDRHEDIEQDRREIELEKMAQRLLAGRSGDDVGDVGEHGLEREQVAGVVVDQQDARALTRVGSVLVGHGATRRPCAAAALRRARASAPPRRAAAPAADRCRPAWRCSPMRRRRGISGDRPSSP